MGGGLRSQNFFFTGILFAVFEVYRIFCDKFRARARLLGYHRLRARANRSISFNLRLLRIGAIVENSLADIFGVVVQEDHGVVVVGLAGG